METQSIKPKSSNRKIVMIVSGIICGLCLIFLVSGAISNALSPAAPKPTIDVNSIGTSAAQTAWAPLAQTVQAKPAATSIPLPLSTSTLEPEASLRQNIEYMLGSSNRKVQRLTALNFNDPEKGAIFVNWTINDNLTTDFIIVSAKKDAAGILKIIYESGTDYTYVLLSGSFPLTDNFGNVKETNVVNLTFYKATVAKINWQNFLSDDIYKIADIAAVWKEFQTP